MKTGRWAIATVCAFVAYQHLQLEVAPLGAVPMRPREGVVGCGRPISPASSELRRETNIDVDPETNSTRSNGGTPAQPIRGGTPYLGSHFTQG